jgi:hypothetical protein
MHYQTRWLTLVIVSTIGTVGAIFYPFILLPNSWFLVAKLSFGVALGTMLTFKQRRKLLGILVFFVITFLLGGAIFALNYLIFSNLTLALINPVAPLPMGVISLAGVIFYFMIKKLFNKLYKFKETARYESKTIVTLMGKDFKLNGFIDSGNKLFFKGQPVALLSKNIIQKETGMDIQNSKDFMKIKTIAGQTKIPIINATKIVLYSGTSMNIIYNIPIGLTENEFKGFDILLPPAVLRAS